jgi:DedD protein
MENRLKERLTGAAILVALIVLIVPEIFRGQPTVTGAARVPQAPDGAPVRSYTIDLNAARAPGASPELVAPPSAAAPAGATKVPATAPAKAAAKAPVKTATRPPPAALHGPAAASVAARSAVGAAAARGAARAVHVKTAGEAGWSVQLGLFSKADNATRLAHTAHGKGFAGRVSRSTRGLYRVALVGLADRAAALRVSRRLKAAGLPAAIMGPR